MNEENKAAEPIEPGEAANLPEPAPEKNLMEHATENPVADVTEVVQPIPLSEEQFLETETLVIADESHEEAEAETAEEDYSTYSISDLVGLLEQYVNELEVPRFKSRVANIRNYLSNVFAAAAEVAREKFIEEGGNRDDFAPVPDPLEERYYQALKRFNKKRIEYNEKLERQRQDNLVAKNEILKLLKDLIQNEDNMNKAFERFHELQAKWRTVGPVPSSNVKDLQLTYKFLIDKFYDFIKINRELQDLDHRRNLEAKLHLCEQAEELLIESSLNNAFRRLHQIQDKWRETGPVPREKKNEIWDRFKATCDKLFERHKEYIAESSAKRARNLEEKTALCLNVEAIVTDTAWKHKDWQEATAKIGGFQTDWKKIGQADKKVNDEIWNRFRTACDKFYKAKNDFYQKRKQEFAANLQLKTELCIQAEALQNSNDWKTTTAELIRLQQEWKKSGPVGEKQSEKIWKRFRTACDAFFHHKSEHFSSMDKEYDVNLEKKLALISEIEAFVPGDDAHASFEELKAFQRRWSELGMVPLQKKDEINTRYKSIIDGHFDKLKATSGDRPRGRFQHQHQQQHRHESNRYHQEVYRKGDDERRSLVNKIAELKNDVQVWENNIGFFAKSKNADKLKSEFEEKINQAKAEINLLKSRLESPKN